MASLQQIQSRRKAVKNVGQITKAMEVVATTKMRKSQEVALSSRPYAYKIMELLDRMTRHAPIQTPFTEHRAVKKTLVVIMTSDRGLIGSFNSQVFKFGDRFFANDEYKDKKGHQYNVVTIGKKATAYATKKGLNIVESFQGFADYVSPDEVNPLIELINQGYLEGKWDRVMTISMLFRSTLKQEVLERQILPIDVDRVRQTIKDIVPETGLHSDEKGDDTVHVNQDKESDLYIFEPTPTQAINALMPHLVKMELYHLVLEANASEHSARRVAMKSASDNASELSTTLTLAFNKARKANITKAIIEITSTQEALG